MKSKKKRKQPRHSPHYYRTVRRGLLRTFLFGVLAGALFFFSFLKGRSLEDQNAAARWEPEGQFAQVSVFLPESAAMYERDIENIRAQILQGLTVDSILSPEEDRNNIPVRECWSTSGFKTIRAGSVSMDVEAIGTGGDFFLFHPVRLLSGAYYLKNNLMQDQILLDETAAWTLFGAYEVEGRTVTDETGTYTVAGVFRMPSLGLAERAVPAQPIAFISYTAFSGTADGSDAGNTDSGDSSEVSEAGITCVEFLMPNPVDGYAKQAVLKAAGVDEKGIVCVDNTARYRPASLFNRLKLLGTWGVRAVPIRFPYWENAAVSVEEILSILLAAEGLFIILAAISLIRVIVYIYIHRRWSLAGTVHSMQEAVYRRQSEKLYPEYYAEKENSGEETEDAESPEEKQ